jgi:hypothetical protein
MPHKHKGVPAIQGALKTKMSGLDVVGWFLGGQKPKNYQGWSDLFFISYFLTPLTEKRPKM